MKTLISFTALAVALSAGSALAADLPSIKSAPVAAPTPMWTGFYAGLNAGGTWANNNTAYAYATPLYSISPLYQPGTNSSVVGLTSPLYTNRSSGFIGGAQVGYNIELQKNIVVGVETDFQGFGTSTNPGQFKFTDVPSSVNSPIAGNFQTNTYTSMEASKSVSYLGTVRGRLGYLPLANFLIYATGGLAYGGANISFNGWQIKMDQPVELGPGQISSSQNLVGWTAGGGAEWMFNSNWSAKVEYMYYNLGGITTQSGGYVTRVWMPGTYVNAIPYGQVIGLTQTRVSSSTIDGNIVRAGVNYHFNFASAPVVAKF